MSNASISSPVLIYNDVLWSFSYIILPIAFILGNIGNCMNLILFSQSSSRANSCLLYFLSASIINVYILNYSLALRILRDIWKINPDVSSLGFCRWRSYSISGSLLIYRYSILFACIDRMCASSRNARMRMISRPKIAYLIIAGIWIVVLIYVIPNAVFPVFLFGQCIAQPGSTYASYVTVMSLVQAVFILSSMVISGLITFRHLKKMNTQIVPLHSAAANERKVVGQYITMLFVQVATDFVCNVNYPMYLIATLIYPGLTGVQNGALSSFLVNLAFNITFVNYSAGFYLHTLSSTAFRRKLVHLLKLCSCFNWCLSPQREEQNTGAIAMLKRPTQNTTAVN